MRMSLIHHEASELPEVDLGGGRARVIAGSAFGAASPLQTASETLYADVTLARRRRLPLDPTTEERAIYTLSGEIEIGGRAFPAANCCCCAPAIR